VVVTLTNDEETNILTSLLAKRMGAGKTITKINRFSYFPLMTAIGIEQVVSTRLSAINTILQHIRRGKVLSAISLKGEQAEALEVVALETSDIVGKPLKRIAFPKGAIVASIIRHDQVIIPTGDSIIQPDDRVIIFAQRRAIGGIEKLTGRQAGVFLMRWRYILYTTGQPDFFFGLTMLLPLGFGAFYGDASVKPLLQSMAITVSAGLLLLLLVPPGARRQYQPARRHGHRGHRVDRGRVVRGAALLSVGRALAICGRRFRIGQRFFHHRAPPS
jgi:hypothetical protein